MGARLYDKTGKSKSITEEDREKFLEISIKLEEKLQKRLRAYKEKVRKFNRKIRKKFKGRHLKCCDGCLKLFPIKVIKEIEERRESGRGDPSLWMIRSADCPYCKNNVVLKEEFLRCLPHPILVYPD